MADLYTVLGVTRAADERSIREAYRRLARRHHPDAGGDQDRMMVLNKAYHILGNPERRAAYDARRSRPRSEIPQTRDGHRVLDFGRYEGWTIPEIAAEDDNYLEWLRRTQTGRALRREIDEVLASRAIAVEDLRPRSAPTRRRRFGRG